MKYTMVIQYDPRDDIYVVSLPEFEKDGLIGGTHGKTYEEAARMGTEMLELVIETWKQEGRPLPAPRVFPVKAAV